MIHPPKLETSPKASDKGGFVQHNIYEIEGKVQKNKVIMIELTVTERINISAKSTNAICETVAMQRKTMDT